MELWKVEEAVDGAGAANTSAWGAEEEEGAVHFLSRFSLIQCGDFS
jgi:hypothetical protein